MYVISNDKITDAYAHSSVDHQLKTFRQLYNSNNPLSDIETKFVDNFVSCLENGMRMLDGNVEPRDVLGYVNVRKFMTDNGLTPEDLEYTLVGNTVFAYIIADTPRYSFGNALDASRSYGHMPSFTKIVSNDPDTVIFFSDGSSVRVTAENGSFDDKTGIYIALLKKALGSQNLQRLFSLIADAKKTAPKSDTETAPKSDTETASKSDTELASV